MSAPRKPQLSVAQQFSVEQARALIARAPTDLFADECPSMDAGHGNAQAYALGRLKPYVEDLLAIIDAAGSAVRVDQLAALADSIDERLEDENTSRQAIAEDVAAQLRMLAAGGEQP